MSELRYLLDTDVCIDLLRMPPEKIPSAIAALKSENLILSSIVLAELETGVRKSSRVAVHAKRLRFFAGQITPAVFDANASAHYGEIRAHLEQKGTSIGPLDMLIAAHARSLGARLITGNMREFRRVPDIECLAWKPRGQ